MDVFPCNYISDDPPSKTAKVQKFVPHIVESQSLSIEISGGDCPQQSFRKLPLCITVIPKIRMQTVGCLMEETLAMRFECSQLEREQRTTERVYRAVDRLGGTEEREREASQ